MQKLLALFALSIVACSQGPIHVQAAPDMPISEAIAGWNDLCHTELFEEAPGLVRIEWADDLGYGRMALDKGYLIQVSRSALEGKTHADLVAVIAHELGHVLMSGDTSGDGWGHYDGGIMSRLSGSDLPTEADREHLISRGVSCP